jgi:hypothetical protein
MIADYMTKPLVGGKFQALRNLIMNFLNRKASITQSIGQQECVGG